MCAKIVNLNELVGEDIAFEYGNPKRLYTVPGDIDVNTVFELFDMFQGLTQIEADDPNELFGEVKDKFLQIRARLLTLFQVREPRLRDIPFGVRGTGIVLRTILGELGITVTQDAPADPPKPARATAQRGSGSRTSRTTKRPARKR